MSRTISQILGEYRGFDKAFWATYSVDFSTLDFLLKNDFKQIMTPYYFHLICDGNKLDEAIAAIYKDRKDMSKLFRLQEYCTISPQFTDGAFHPKILLFASEKSILLILTSLNRHDIVGNKIAGPSYTEGGRAMFTLLKLLHRMRRIHRRRMMGRSAVAGISYYASILPLFGLGVIFPFLLPIFWLAAAGVFIFAVIHSFFILLWADAAILW